MIRSTLLLFVWFLATGLAPAAAAPMVFSIEGTPGTVAGGDTVLFDVYLRGLDATLPGPVISFALNVAASDSSLTAGGTNFSRFGFTLDSSLIGVIGGLLFSDSDISDDGRVEFIADTPPFGAEEGIPAGAGDVRLGALSVVAPNVAGSYSVNLALDAQNPFFGSFLLIDDGSPFGLLAPEDLLLSVGGASFEVDGGSQPAVPEPSSLALFTLGTVGFVGRRIYRLLV